MLCNVLIALSTATAVVAHGGVIGYTVGGNYYPGFRPYNSASGQSTIGRQYATHDPITSATDGSLACNKPGTVTNPQLSATAPAGSQITAYWGNWPHDVGPVMVYMANCGGSCTNANPSSLNWFKIDESGLISGQLRQGFWGQGQLQKSNNSWTSTIPKKCAQLTVTGGGSGNPSPTVRFPGAYNQNDPSINIDLYSQTGTTYNIPGGPVWRG